MNCNDVVNVFCQVSLLFFISKLLDTESSPRHIKSMQECYSVTHDLTNDACTFQGLIQLKPLCQIIDDHSDCINA